MNQHNFFCILSHFSFNVKPYTEIFFDFFAKCAFFFASLPKTPIFYHISLALSIAFPKIPPTAPQRVPI